MLDDGFRLVHPMISGRNGRRLHAAPPSFRAPTARGGVLAEAYSEYCRPCQFFLILWIVIPNNEKNGPHCKTTRTTEEGVSAGRTTRQGRIEARHMGGGGPLRARSPGAATANAPAAPRRRMESHGILFLFRPGALGNARHTRFPALRRPGGRTRRDRTCLSAQIFT